ncbi:uncharacterized protein EV422DRAFT_543056 [Fimicolochytrium jonesii]|uniref:uncharacterized protein n=1 Tax=Fimicolochytrium jonesii TaxID=1396493 RepID=UPI0022FDCC4B|nr:uncharacterized protein EV422DRAFT_543056 [Fimicolochytrium jonesii]KAI8817021.1 hypothetical protein EV422DRAFT_543056 [Fimicolochytrium jonesii]
MVHEVVSEKSPEESPEELPEESPEDRSPVVPLELLSSILKFASFKTLITLRAASVTFRNEANRLLDSKFGWTSSMRVGPVIQYVASTGELRKYAGCARALVALYKKSTVSVRREKDAPREYHFDGRCAELTGKRPYPTVVRTLIEALGEDRERCQKQECAERQAKIWKEITPDCFNCPESVIARSIDFPAFKSIFTLNTHHSFAVFTYYGKPRGYCLECERPPGSCDIMCVGKLVMNGKKQKCGAFLKEEMCQYKTKGWRCTRCWRLYAKEESTTCGFGLPMILCDIWCPLKHPTKTGVRRCRRDPDDPSEDESSEDEDSEDELSGAKDSLAVGCKSDLGVA